MVKAKLDRVIIGLGNFKKALEHEGIAQYILWIENTYVGKVESVQELLEKIESSDEKSVEYVDDVEFEVYTLSRKLADYSIPHEYIEGDPEVD